MHLRTGCDFMEFVLEHVRHRGDLQGESQEGINEAQ